MHFIKYCRGCECVITQCRCADPNKTITYGLCSNCSQLSLMKEENVMPEETEVIDLVKEAYDIVQEIKLMRPRLSKLEMTVDIAMAAVALFDASSRAIHTALFAESAKKNEADPK